MMELHADPKQLVKQGAEALVYKTTFIDPTIPALLKIRPTKPYRHPILDMRLTRHRCLAEARLLYRCYSNGVSCPAIYYLDEEAGAILMEWISGSSMRDVLDAIFSHVEQDSSHRLEKSLVMLMGMLGQTVATLHNIGVIHGDLTTSNIMLQGSERTELLSKEHVISRIQDNETGSLQVVLIDFGLGFVSTTEEDKAVDLYVLERAFISTHPQAETLFESFMASYSLHCKSSRGVLKRLQEVRLRGRKRSMLG